LRLELDAVLAELRVIVTDAAGRSPRAQQFAVSAAPAGEPSIAPPPAGAGSGAGKGAGTGVLSSALPDGLFLLEGLEPGAWTITLTDMGARASDPGDDRMLQKLAVVLAPGEVRTLQLSPAGP